MKKVTLIFLFISTSLLAQNSNYFKDTPVLDGTEPNWIAKMYSELPNVYLVSKLYDAYYREHVFEKNIHTQNYKYWLKNVSHLVDSEGNLTLDSEKEYYKNVKEQQALHMSTKNFNSTSNWINIGPNETYTNNGSLSTRPTQAHVNSIAIAPSDINIMYAAAAGGGLFKSINKGLNWNIIAEHEIITNATDIKVHPTNPNTLYLAFGKSIFKSVDGGNNWVELYINTGNIEQFLINNNNPNIIFAATATGLLKSTDNGTNWTVILIDRCWDIVAHATDNTIIYLSVSNPTLKRAEIYKSSDSGNTWNLKDTDWYSPTDINQASDIGCKLATTPADPNRVYACLIGNSKADDNGWIGVYYSLDNADTWVNSDDIDGGPYAQGNDVNTNWFYAGYSSGYHQGWYNFDLEVSHINPDKIWVGTIWFMESNNKGRNLEYVRGTRNLSMHADIQDLEVVGDDVWVASDGGLNYSNDECQTVSTKNTGISGSDFWNFSQGWNEDTWTGGRYHNGDAIYHENFGVGNTLFLGGAESPTGYINPLNNRKSYYSDISDKLTPDSLSEVAESVGNIAIYPNQSYWLLNSSEIEYDPRYANIMYLGKDNTFYKSLDEGASFTGLHSFEEGSTVLEFDISRKDPNIMYCLVNVNGSVKLFQTLNGGVSFTEKAIPFNGSKVDLSLDTATENHLWIVNHHGSNGNKVYESIDGGNTWVNRTTNTLDSHKIVDIVYQLGSDNIVYIVSDSELFYWNNALNDWTIYSTGLPFKKRALKMIPFYRDGKLRLSGGRGVWESPLVSASLPIAQPITLTSHVYCHREEVQFEDFSVLNHTNSSWSWSFPGASNVSSSTIRNPLVTYDTPGVYDVSLTVTDGSGNTDTKVVTGMIKVEEDICGLDLYAEQAISLSSANQQYLSNTEVNIPDISNFTFTGWVKPNGIQENYSGIFSLSSGNGDEKNVLNFREGNNTLGFHWNGSQWSWDSNLIVPENEWSFVAITVTPSEIKLYVNEEMAVRTFSSTPFELNRILLGRYYGWESRNFNGLLEESSFYTRTLTDDEIRLSRHLTKQDVSDSNLIAYYQFNSLNNNKIYDKKSGYDLIGNNAPITIPSSAPVGAGTSEKLTITSNGISNFSIPGVSMQFVSGIVPNGEVIATRINNQPNIITSNPSLGDYYWIINNYGSNSVFTGLDDITFSNVGDQSSVLTEDIALYKRNSNQELESDWSQVGIASENNTTLATISFDDNSITSFSQFYLSNTSTLSIDDENNILPTLIYPNPIVRGNELFISKMTTPTIFTLYAIDGKQVFRKEISIEESVTIPHVQTGMYFYTMVSSTQIEKGKLLIK